jgi:hypothetical protein
MRSQRVPRVSFAVVIAAVLAIPCRAQEVGFVDLTAVKARTDLRRPPSSANTRAERKEGIERDDELLCLVSGNSQLLTTLVSLDRVDYQVGDEPTFEVTVENVSSAPLRLPFSPHLADLQPEDPAQRFVYSELRLTLWIAGQDWEAPTGAVVSLYGTDDQAATMVTLNHAEWVRIIGRGKLDLTGNARLLKLIRKGHVVDRTFAEVSLARVQTLLTATATTKIRHEICIEQDHGQPTAITLTVTQP